MDKKDKFIVKLPLSHAQAQHLKSKIRLHTAKTNVFHARRIGIVRESSIH
jgi:hypothetical protein